MVITGNRTSSSCYHSALWSGDIFLKAVGLRTLPVYLQAVSSLKIRRAEENALYRCIASNKLGKDQRNIFFHVTRECLVPSVV